ncbi:hypothetical protein FRC11_001590 [Ceratobasidium sp. 423]|nr:hypothetical protein FRC11_001590 [Ceratobasidium sp. 423]
MNLAASPAISAPPTPAAQVNSKAPPVLSAKDHYKQIIAELTGQFLAKSTATHEKKPTAWNGLVFKVSSELAHKKEEPEFRGAEFMCYVVQYIHDNNLYKDLTEKQKEELVAYTQKVHNDQVNAGQTKTIDQQLSQGSVKDEIFAMCKWTHLKLEMANVIPLLEESIINGAASVVKEIQKTKTLLKTKLHKHLTNVLCA